MFNNVKRKEHESLTHAPSFLMSFLDGRMISVYQQGISEETVRKWVETEVANASVRSRGTSIQSAWHDGNTSIGERL